MVDRKISATHGTASHRGYHDRQIWRFAPNCDEGTCSVALRRRTPSGGRVTILLRPHGSGEYVGEDHYLAAGDCGRDNQPRTHHVRSVYSLRVTHSSGGRAVVFRGTQETRFRPTSARCDGQRYAYGYERFSLFGRL